MEGVGTVPGEGPRSRGAQDAATAVGAPKDARRRASEVALRHGWNAVALQTLGDGFRYFFHGGGYVAYVDTGAAWVAAGDPVAPPGHLAEVGAAFLEAARRAGRRCCFFATEGHFAAALAHRATSLPIGEQPVWDPREWEATLGAHRRLREQVRRARAKGVRTREVAAASAPESPDVAVPDAAARDLLEQWLATRRMPPMGFLVRPSAEPGPHRHRFVAERDGRLVGLAQVLPVPGRRGWFVEHLFRAPDAPNGTVELLVDAVMRWAAERGSPWLTLGLAPLAGEVAWPLRVARRRTRRFYDFEGLRRFKARLRPRAWHPIYVTHPAGQSAVRTMLDVLAAFTRDGFLRFGLRTVARGSPVVLGALAAALVPWTALLAAAPAAPWFAGHAAVKWAWVGFDAALALGLWRLLRRPTPRLAGALAAVVGADALLTTVEAAAWNLPRLHSGPEAAVVALACAAPAAAAVALWGARRRLRQAVAEG